MTTRAVALETGISVGTLYEYFPSKQALLSGYVRHAMAAMLDRLVEPTCAGNWQARLTGLVRLTAGADNEGLPVVDREMLLLETHIAEPTHHRRFYEELVCAWRASLAQCHDLPQMPSAETLSTLAVAAWGGRHYLLLVDPADLSLTQWARQMEVLCRAALGDREISGDER